MQGFNGKTLTSFRLDVDDYFTGEEYLGSDEFIGVCRRVFLDQGFVLPDVCELSSDGLGWELFCRPVRVGGCDPVSVCLSYAADDSLIIMWTS